MACVAASCLAAWAGAQWSQLSLAYLVVIYLPFAFRLSRPDHDVLKMGLTLFVSVMTVCAVLGIVQVGAQAIGWSYHDPFAVLPSSFVLHDYNSVAPIRYGSNFYRANGFVFLEPSFFSQFLALALVAQVYLGRRSLATTLLFGVALVAAFSGTGIILAAAGMTLVGMQRRTQLTRLALPILAVVIAVAVSPLGSFFTTRMHEFSTAHSSAQSRFVTPYQLARDSLSTDGAALLRGNGPGSAERLAKSVAGETGLKPVFPVAPKLAYEYGAPAMCIFLLFVFSTALGRPPSRPLAAVLLVMYVTLQGSLLQPTTVFLLYIFTALFAAEGTRESGASSDLPADGRQVLARRGGRTGVARPTTAP